MEKEWTKEQQMGYKGLSFIEFKDKLINDLEEAKQWVQHNDFDSAFRYASGATLAMTNNEDFLFSCAVSIQKIEVIKNE